MYMLVDRFGVKASFAGRIAMAELEPETGVKCADRTAIFHQG